MRVFSCHHCGQPVSFEDDQCLRCQSPLGYLPELSDVLALVEAAPDRFVDLSGGLQTWQRCATRWATGCNWLVPSGSGLMCASCSLTRVRPADSDAVGMAEFVRAETAKRRLLFQLGQLGLPIEPRDEGRGVGLCFDLLSSTATKVVTGHDNGIITLDLAEADAEHRERLRNQLGEPYRTLLGHFRHEIGHYFWSILVQPGPLLDACRALFGDDRLDYQQAVNDHYAKQAGGTEWQADHISQYATMHPYEDWAETFAHYLHIYDTLQTASSFRLRPREALVVAFGDMIEAWVELTRGLNEVNRSMGRGDLYPFVLAPAVIRKLSFVDQVVRQAGGRDLQFATLGSP
jgi:hypothetical protein